VSTEAHLSDVCRGHLPGATVGGWLTANASAIVSLPYVLISSVDSCSDVGAMPWATSRRISDPGWALSEAPLVISGAAVVDLLKAGLFTGFDELWIPGSIPVADPPTSASLVSPRRLDESLPLAVVDWLTASGCHLGVGDGDGMSFVVVDRVLGARLSLGPELGAGGSAGQRWIG